MQDRNTVRLGSLFDGIGGWCLAAIHAGILPVWSSEIERFPLEVTKRRFPYVAQLGDITKIDASKIESVDIICAGSPCQDLSIAGKREGLQGERSGLFRTAIDIVRQMRMHTGGAFPRFFVWENVPGAFSSNKGLDFRAVLEEIGESKVPMPESNKWASAGLVQFPGVEIAWRVLDAQYWGVPQRRKRIFLIADFGGRCAGEILFEPQGVRGDITESGNERKGAAGRLKGSAGEASGACVTAYCIQGNVVDRDSAQNDTDRPAVYGFNTMVSGADSNPVLREKTPSMRTTTRLGVALLDNHASDSRITSPLNIAPTENVTVLNDQGGNVMTVMDNLTPTLWAKAHGNIPIVSCTSNTVDRHTFASKSYSRLDEDCVMSTLRSSGGAYSGGSENYVLDKAVRRLTPLECERLQGLPDNWTLINDKSCSNSARYKAIGNGMAQPCADWILKRIMEVAYRKT